MQLFKTPLPALFIYACLLVHAKAAPVSQDSSIHLHRRDDLSFGSLVPRAGTSRPQKKKWNASNVSVKNDIGYHKVIAKYHSDRELEDLPNIKQDVDRHVEKHMKENPGATTKDAYGVAAKYHNTMLKTVTKFGAPDASAIGHHVNSLAYIGRKQEAAEKEAAAAKKESAKRKAGSSKSR